MLAGSPDKKAPAETAVNRMAAASRWATLEGAELGTFRQNAPPRLTADLDAVLFAPAGMAVQNVRDEIIASPRAAVAHTSLGAWLDASGTRIGGLRQLKSSAAGDLATTASRDLRAARAGGLRNLGLSLAVLSMVTALGLVLRRSIARPLGEVSEGARTLSHGDLAFDVSYAGRDEIGDVSRRPSATCTSRPSAWSARSGRPTPRSAPTTAWTTARTSTPSRGPGLSC